MDYVRYPLTITFDPTPWAGRFGTEYGIDLEAEMYHVIVDEFQALDPSLSASHIRGEINQQLKHSDLFGGPFDLTIRYSTDELMKFWQSADIPRDFVYGLLEGAVTQLNRSKIKIEWN